MPSFVPQRRKSHVETPSHDHGFEIRFSLKSHFEQTEAFSGLWPRGAPARTSLLWWDRQQDGFNKMGAMTKILSLAAVAALLAVVSSPADARNGFGAPSFSPGQQFRESGPVGGRPGASGYAPGQQMNSLDSVPGHSGASGYAPGHESK